VLEHSKCTHLYHYYQHAQFGQLHVRVQTWFPFSIDVCLNGRQWLARQMDQAGIAYHRQDNCFVWIEDWQKARQLSEQQLRRDWASLLNSLLELAHPLHRAKKAGTCGWRPLSCIPNSSRSTAPKKATQQQKQGRKLRRGVADLYRRAGVSHAANERYLLALVLLEIR
jgi:hypothetical protein